MEPPKYPGGALHPANWLWFRCSGWQGSVGKKPQVEAPNGYIHGSSGKLSGQGSGQSSELKHTHI